MRSDPSNANIHFNLGAAYNARGESAEAAKHFAEACRLRPDDAEARENLGLLLLSQGKPGEAVSCFQESARLQPNAKAHYELALALDASGQGEKAIAEYREAVRLGPTSALFMNDLAWALATNPSQKEQDIKEAVRLTAGDALTLSGGSEPRFLERSTPHTQAPGASTRQSPPPTKRANWPWPPGNSKLRNKPQSDLRCIEPASPTTHHRPLVKMSFTASITPEFR